MKKVWFIVAAACLVFLAAFSTVCLADTPEERAIQAAKEAVQSQGVILADVEIVYDAENKRWEERILAIEKDPSNPNHGKLPHGVLYNKKYSTVFFDFKEGAKEMDIWAFVDKDTNDVLTIYQEK